MKRTYSKNTVNHTKGFQLITTISYFNETLLLKQHCKIEFETTQMKCSVHCRWMVYNDALYQPSSIITMKTTGYDVTQKQSSIITTKTSNCENEQL
jgi:hypothetical protein